MLVAELLAPQAGERVLDVCAAPGGKATHIVALMQNQGFFVANEIHPQRVWDLAENLERWGARNTVVTNEKPENLANYFGPYFDKVLVDAPCSGEGLFRKNPEARVEWNLKLIESCSVRQISILDAAAYLVRPGGILAYSTCTFSPEENEGVLAQFLDDHPEYKIIDHPWRSHFSPGRPEWLPEPGPASLQHAIRVWPHLGTGEGHFIALLQKSKQNGVPANRFQKKRKLPKPALDLFRKFVKENLTLTSEDYQPALFGSYLYCIPEDWPDLGSLRVVHPGWWLGTMKKNRFEPAHAFAMGLEKDQAQRCINMPSTDKDPLLAYMRGENLPCGDMPSGWVLITVDGFSLGWGKNVQGLIKNAYPRGLRRS
jgi:NOL1/NOP2/fmu family ribosome biogenesis protein